MGRIMRIRVRRLAGRLYRKTSVSPRYKVSVVSPMITPPAINNLFDTLCNIGYESARNDACLNQEVTAGANNGNNDNCNKRPFVKSTCEADPFTEDGCDTVEGRTGYVIAYCTTGTTSFHDECLGK